METSGVRIYYSPLLRQYDAETIFIGPLYLELPPMQSRVHQTSLCPGECTASMFPEPVYLSYISPHMHTTGSAMKVTLIRDGMALQVLVNEDQYDYNTPRVKRFSPHVMVMPGDEILVECWFDTSERDEFTFYGDATSAEMCIAVTQYYPKKASATSCWGYENGGEANIGYCGYRYGDEHFVDCNANLAEGDPINSFISNVYGWAQTIGEVCDVTGVECRPGCEQFLDKIRENACFAPDVDGYTKYAKIPDVNKLLQQQNLEFDEKDFIRALVSCDKRDGLTADDSNEQDDRDVTDDDGTCIFNPPGPRTVAVVAAAAQLPLLTALLAAALIVAMLLQM